MYYILQCNVQGDVECTILQLCNVMYNVLYIVKQLYIQAEVQAEQTIIVCTRALHTPQVNYTHLENRTTHDLKLRNYIMKLSLLTEAGSSYPIRGW